MMTSGGQNGRHLGHNDNGIRADKHVYDIPEGDDYMAIYETIDSRKGAKGKNFLLNFMSDFLKFVIFKRLKLLHTSRERVLKSVLPFLQDLLGLWFGFIT